MVEEPVVKETLTSEMIKAGAELTRRLDDARMVSSACLWLYLPESGIWRLIIALQEVASDGPKKVYQKLQSILSEMPEDSPSVLLKDISVVEDSNRLVSLLRTAIRTSQPISGVRFSKNTINGHFLDDAYIYRMT